MDYQDLLRAQEEALRNAKEEEAQPQKKTTTGSVTSEKGGQSKNPSKPTSAKPPNADPKASARNEKPKSVKSSAPNKPALQNLNQSQDEQKFKVSSSAVNTPNQSTGSPPKLKKPDAKVNSARELVGPEKRTSEAPKRQTTTKTDSLKNDSSLSQPNELKEKKAEKPASLHKSASETQKSKAVVSPVNITPDFDIDKPDGDSQIKDSSDAVEKANEAKQPPAGPKTNKSTDRISQLRQKLNENKEAEPTARTSQTPPAQISGKIAKGEETPDIRHSEGGNDTDSPDSEEVLAHELSIIQKLLSDRLNREGELRIKHSQQRKVVKDTFNALRNALHEAEKQLVEKLNSNYDSVMEALRKDYVQTESLYSNTRSLLNKRELTVKLHGTTQDVVADQIVQVIRTDLSLKNLLVETHQENYNQSQSEVLDEVEKYQSALTGVNPSLSGRTKPPNIFAVNFDSSLRDTGANSRGGSRGSSPKGGLLESKSLNRLSSHNFEKNHEAKKATLKTLIRASQNGGDLQSLLKETERILSSPNKSPRPESKVILEARAAFSKLSGQQIWSSQANVSRTLITSMLKRQDKEFTKLLQTRGLK